MYRVRFQPSFPPLHLHIRNPWSRSPSPPSPSSSTSSSSSPPQLPRIKTSTPFSSTSSLHLGVEDRCTICSSTLDVPRPDGQTETLLTLPCGHTFGSICILRWLENVSPNKNCPQCRRSMIYRRCGHLIRPLPYSTAPPTLKNVREMPTQCVVCKGGDMVEERLRMLRERKEAKERALMAMGRFLPGFGDECGLVEGMNGGFNIEGRLGGVREAWWKEVDDLRAELEKERREW